MMCKWTLLPSVGVGLGIVSLSCNVHGQSLPLPPAPAGVEVTHQNGFEFVTIHAPTATGFPTSTEGWTGAGNNYQGRGAATHDYRISRTEITTGQWMTFLNTFAGREIPTNLQQQIGPAIRNTFIVGPYWWGAQVETEVPGSVPNWTPRSIPNAASVPVWGLGWRGAALYCNWLHNNQSSDWSSLLNGAYDTSTWGRRAQDGTFTDAVTHEVGARYWIPSLDELITASNWDPNRYGQGHGGWWMRPNRTDNLPVPGWPGDPGATSAAGLPVFIGDFFATPLLDIPVGSYPNAQSPWGLLDTAGGVSELTEEPYSRGATPGTFTGRRALGATSGVETPDLVGLGDFYLQYSTRILLELRIV